MTKKILIAFVLFITAINLQAAVGVGYSDVGTLNSIRIKVGFYNPKYFTTSRNVHPFPFDQNKFVIAVRLKNYSSAIMNDLSFEGYIGDKPLTFFIQQAEVIQQNYLESLSQNETNFILLTSQEDFDNNLENESLTFRITSLNGQAINLQYQDTASMFFAKAENSDEAFSFSTDGYNFKNPSEKLSFTEFIYSLRETSLLKFYSPLYRLLKISNGRCYGMSQTSGNYFLDKSTKPYSSEPVFWDSSDVSVLHKITSAQLSQLFNEFIFDNASSYDDLFNELDNNRPMVLAVEYHDDGKRHAVLVTKMTILNNAKKSILNVYDSNFPQTDVFAEVDLNNKNFQLEYRDVNATVFKVKPGALVLNDALVRKYFVNTAKDYFTSGFGFISTACPVYLLIEDQYGNKFGEDDSGNKFFEIDGAVIYKIPTEDAVDDSLTLIYYPKELSITAHMNAYDTGNMRLEKCDSFNEEQLSIISIDSVNITDQTVSKLIEDNGNYNLEIDYNGDGQTDTVITTTPIITNVEDDDIARSGVPNSYWLSSNYPNPFNPSTTIQYNIPNAGYVKLSVYSTLGEEIVSLVDEYKLAGKYTVNFNASTLSSGVYYYKIQVADFIETKKLVLIK